MKRPLFLLILLVFGASLIHCGGGGSSSYDFTGRWLFEETISEDPYGIAAEAGGGVGTVFTDIFVIQENNENIVMTMEDAGWVYNGTCDRKGKTFCATTYITEDNVTVSHTYNGFGETQDTMSGDSIMQAGGYYIKTVWTATLLSRSVSKGKSTGPSFFENILKSIMKTKS